MPSAKRLDDESRDDQALWRYNTSMSYMISHTLMDEVRVIASTMIGQVCTSRGKVTRGVQHRAWTGRNRKWNIDIQIENTKNKRH